MNAPLTMCTPGLNGRCGTHGGLLHGAHCQTVEVLWDVRQRRAAQFAQYGTNEALLDGTGPGAYWIPEVLDTVGYTAPGTETAFRRDYEAYEAQHGAPTWMHLVREEVAEAFMEDDPVKLRDELLDVAALCVSWIEKLDARAQVAARRAD